MSVIKPRTRGRQFVQLRTRLEQQNHETLYAYSAFLGEDTEYVLNELIDGVLAKDKEFVAWRSAHTQPFAPPALSARVPRHAARASDKSSPAAHDAIVSAPLNGRG